MLFYAATWKYSVRCVFVMTLGCIVHVVVWCDGRKEVWVWPAEVTHSELWVGRMTLRPGWEGGEWCIKTAITTLLDCKQMYCWLHWTLHCCTLGLPGAKFVLDMSHVCQTRSVKCKLQLSLIMQQGILWPWLWFGWFGEFTYHHYRL